MKKIPTIYKYSHKDVDYNISFLLKKNCHMINATEMAKPFNKQIHLFLQDSQRYEMVYKLCLRNSLSIKDREISPSLSLSELAKLFPESIIIVKGANNQQGTWFHEDIALEFARWLSVDFAIWCNDKIKELLRIGYTYLITAQPNELNDHIIPQVQRNNTKAIVKKIYEPEKNTQEIINYFRSLSKKILGVPPKTIVSHAKNNGVPLSVINKGSREILRYYSSSATACMSLIENIISSNPDMTIDNVDELMPHVITLESFFAKMIEIGHYDSKELKKIRGYENLKKGLNN